MPGPVVGILGVRRRGSAWSFPLDLGFAGMPGCTLQFEPVRLLVVWPGGDIDVGLPASSPRWGAVCYEQVVSGFGKPPPWDWTTALGMTIGAR